MSPMLLKTVSIIGYAYNFCLHHSEIHLTSQQCMVSSTDSSNDNVWSTLCYHYTSWIEDNLLHI